MAKGPPFEQRVRLAAALAIRLNSLLPPEVSVVADPDASVGVWSDGWWGGIDLAEVDYDSIESLAEYALCSLQDNVAHAVNGAWPPVGAPRLNLPWVRRDGALVRLGFNGGIQLEPIPVVELGVE